MAKAEQKSLTMRDLVDAICAEDVSNTESVDVVERVRELMSSYDADLNEWKRYEFFDEKRYTRNLIATDNDKFALMLLCWPKGSASSIHDHAASNCWLRVVKGRVHELQYKADAHGALHETVNFKHDAGAVTYIHDKIGLHKIANASDDEPLVTLHLYSPPFESCTVFLDLQGQQKETRNFCFFSEHGVKVEYD